VGDCDGSGDVTVDELITMVNIALGNTQLSRCTAGDANSDNQITIDEILSAVNNALNGCPPPQTSPTPTPRFEDNGDGTITDGITGLMWEKKSDDGSIHNKDGRFPWAGKCTISTAKYCQPDSAAKATCEAGTAPGTVGCDTCNSGEGSCKAASTIWTWLDQVNAEGGTGFAGHNDWRIPKTSEKMLRKGSPAAFELDSLIYPAEYPYCTTPPCTYSAFNTGCVTSCTVLTCSCTQFFYYWSATTQAGFPLAAWTVYLTNGAVYSGAKTDGHYVRAVRGGL
jgi:hypothetical protein